MIPVVVRSSEEMLRLVPNELREASLRARRAEVADDPQGRAAAPRSPGITTGVMLAIARVIGETAPLLIVGGLHRRA